MESLLGVIIGGLITAVVNIINQHYSLKREEKQFEREQEAKKEEKNGRKMNQKISVTFLKMHTAHLRLS